MQVKLINIFYSWMWKKHRKYYCEACGKKLLQAFSSEVNTSIMDHLLEKNDNCYPECAYSKSNIIWVHPECHSKKTNGFPLPKHKERIEWAKENYELLVKESKEFKEKVVNLIKNNN